MNNNKSLTQVLVGAAIIVAAYLLQTHGLPTSTPVVARAEPSAELQTIVAPIKTQFAANPSAKQVGWWYRDAAAVIRTDTRVTSTEQLRQWVMDFEKQVGAGVIQPGAIPGLGAACNQVVEARIGLENAPVTPELRVKFADTLDAIGWALGG